MMKMLLLITVVCVIGCNPLSRKDIKGVYENRVDIVSVFNKISVFRKKTGNSLFLYTYNDSLKNEYVFDLNQGNYLLFRESVSFNPDSILGVDKIGTDNVIYERQLANKLKSFLNKMDALRISDVSSDFLKQGVTLKIYMQSNGVLVYIQNHKASLGPRWRTYVEAMQKIDDNWYYGEE